MIIQCPACSTRYAVPDSALGPDGRAVRCAKCRHSWFQNGPSVVQNPLPHDEQGRFSPDEGPVTMPSSAVPVQTPVPDQHHTQHPAPTSQNPFADSSRKLKADAAPLGVLEPEHNINWATVTEHDAAFDTEELSPQSSSLASPPSSEEVNPVFLSMGKTPGTSPSASTDGSEALSSFGYAPPFIPKRRPVRRWITAVVIFGAVMATSVSAIRHFGLPDWFPFYLGGDFAGDSRLADLTLRFPASLQERRSLPGGTQYFGVDGTVTNNGVQQRAVPHLMVLLRNRQGAVVYRWEITPPKPELAPGESESVLEAVTNIPASAHVAEIGWKTDR